MVGWRVDSSPAGFHWTATLESAGTYRWVMDMDQGRSVYEPMFNHEGQGYLHRVRLVRGSF